MIALTIFLDITLSVPIIAIDNAIIHQKYFGGTLSMSEAKQPTSFQRTKLSTAIRATLPVLAAGGIVAEQPAYAQASADDEVIEELVVTGHRQSLQTAQALKQNSSVIVDSITAEDIGALPDRSVTETLQRVPGVSIHRFRGASDPDHFSVEGSGLVVRGLTYVRSEVNGRDSFTANNGRGLSFADVPPELLAGVDVFKSPSANAVEGGIAGTVNLRTRKPFDQGENIFAFSAESNYGDFIEESSPTGSALASYRWETDAGEFGILGSAVYSNVRSRADRFQVSNFAERTLYSSGDVIDTGGGETPVGTVIFPRGAVVGTQEYDNERYGYSAALQWKSPDENMEATFQFLRSDSRQAWTERVVEIATDVVSDGGRDSFAVPGTTLEFDNNALFDNGYITAPSSGWRDDQWSGDPRTPITALPSNNIRRDVKQKFVTDDFGINFTWDLANDWALAFDYQHVKSTVDNLDFQLMGASFQNLALDLNGNSVPNVQFTQPEICTDPQSNTCPTYLRDPYTSYTDPANSFWRSAMDHAEESEGTSDAFKIDAEKFIDNGGFISAMRFGARYADRDQVARYSTYNWGSLSETWAGGGPVWMHEPIAGNGGQPVGDLEVYGYDNFFDGNALNPMSSSGGRVFYALNTVENYDQVEAMGTAIRDQWLSEGSGHSGMWIPLRQRAGADGWFIPNELNPVREKNGAAYFMVDFDKNLDNGWALSGNVGVRYSKTTREASGFQVFEFQQFTTEQGCTDPLPPGQSRSAFCQLSPEVRQQARDYANGAMTPFTAKLDYDYWLPSINVKLEVADGLQFRAAYFQGVAPPDFGLTRAFFPIDLGVNQEDIDAGGGRPIGRFDAGNPMLLPVESNNIDLTAEWYFSEVGQLSLAVFYKELKNIRTNDVQRQSFTNNGATFDAIVTTAINSQETGKIKGFEVAYQQTYDNLPGFLSGLGLSANYTYVDSSNVPQSTLSSTEPDVRAGNQASVDISKLPLEGLSEHTINITPFLEYGDWSARLAYSWRDEFLLTVRDVIVPFQPIMHEATGQLDGTVFWQFHDNWKLGLQAVNLTQETLKTSAIVNDDLFQAPRSWFINDRRFSLILRGHFGN